MLNTVIFDMDGLLLDTEPLWGQSMLRVAKAHNIPITPDQFKETTGLKIHEVTHYWSIKYPWEGNPFEVVAEDILDDIIALAKKEGSVLPGVNSLLELLKNNDFKLGVATSSPTRMMNELIHYFKLNDYFSYMASADEVGFGKPHPAVFLRCAEKLNSTALECLVLEDSLNGVIAGKAARMKVIAVPDDIHFNDIRYTLADMKLKSLEELNMEIIRSF